MSFETVSRAAQLGWNIVDSINYKSLMENSRTWELKPLLLLPGGMYTDRIKALKRNQRFGIYKVDSPERDLQGLVLSEAMRTYQTYL